MVLLYPDHLCTVEVSILEGILVGLDGVGKAAVSVNVNLNFYIPVPEDGF